MDNNSITSNQFQYTRRKTNTVQIGELKIGSDYPVCIQSMTNTNTQDVEKTIEQSIAIIKAGGELVRVTAPGIKDAEVLGDIKAGLNKAGYTTPIVADIHFNPNAAHIAAQKVEKVRINPGNFVDKKKFEHIEYNDAEYNEELERIEQAFLPLLDVCKTNNTALRIGTNHGSLSDRILSRYGDTPLGMVESALEFLRLCTREKFHDVVLSMKASNTQVMVQAYRLLVYKMDEEGMEFPLHLGVTEAGEGEDGRIKSAVGIGTLLADGLGDTIRVSLTEAPEAEIPVAKKIVQYFDSLKEHRQVYYPACKAYDPFSYQKRKSHAVANIGNNQTVVVFADLSEEQLIEPCTLASIGYEYLEPQDKWRIKDQAPEFVWVNTSNIDHKLPQNLKLVAEFEVYQELQAKGHVVYPVFDLQNYASQPNRGNQINFVRINANEFDVKKIESIKEDKTVVYILEVHRKFQSEAPIHSIAEFRSVFFELLNRGITTPVIIKQDSDLQGIEDLQLIAATEVGALLIDGLGDGIFVTNRNSTAITASQINALSFNILQATRVRISKTEYISCPSCGRTLFDLQTTTATIRKETAHLKGLKIGIMGCIVNGPGEMADADYGYVGTGPGKITLYKGQNVVKRNIPSKGAVGELIELIKNNDDWIEPVQ